MSQDISANIDFNLFGLKDSILKAVSELGFEIPTPIQVLTIPLFMSGIDVLGQAQTGTGKTAAFGLPLLSRIDLANRTPQVLVLTPTRELAIQVAEDFKSYAKHIRGFKVLPVYGGQDIRGQLRELKKGVHVVVGTPGRVMDHIRRKTLKLNELISIILDEADEMLHMGFLEDVDWILEHTPDKCQMGLFSATLPPAIRKIAKAHMNKPKEIIIKDRTTTAETLNHRFWIVQGMHKLDALTRIFEGESYDGVLIFVRTKVATVELANQMEARGFAVVPLNGDIPQSERERTIEKLKRGKVDMIVATDVAARGLDVSRISHVVNYDIPHDTEGYVHRVGRTGRAGRSGEAILFISPREKWMLNAIEKATRQKIEPLVLPTVKIINDIRINDFLKRITDNLENKEKEFYRRLVEQYSEAYDVDPFDIAAALAKMVHSEKPLRLVEKHLKERPIAIQRTREDKGFPKKKRGRDRGGDRGGDRQERGTDHYRIEVGFIHGAGKGNIVGAIANEAGLDSKQIGQIQIHDDHSTVDLPKGLSKGSLTKLKTARVAGQKLQISSITEGRKKPKSKGKSKFVRKRKKR
ncbi:MAG: DEAD/DEAH box helicase [Candidatus Electryonea clarkiae]|nr:DEAD/DEAH box helicase [Candidatus Electryonea clarkiae]MDP8286643.1 DEAD/DEAH box helicase [Candidatus Electryonea clarkiae]